MASVLIRFLFAALAFAAAPAWAQPTPAWTYDGDGTGQEDWEFLSPENAPCGLGMMQSPIEISRTEKAGLPALDPRYRPSDATLSLHDHAIEVQPGEGNLLALDGRSYRLRSIRLHTPSEHIVRDKFFPLEIQLLHEGEHGQKLIVAVFADFGAENAALQAIADALPPKENMLPAFDSSLLLPAKREYYAYTGSLTAPPCAEGVEWRILKSPIPMSRSQFSNIARATGRNARLPQPVYMRQVRESDN